MSRRDAWPAYRRWFDDERIGFLREPEGEDLDRIYQRLSTKPQPSTKLWADAYLAAFTEVAGLTIVTFDQAFRKLGQVRAKILMPK